MAQLESSRQSGLGDVKCELGPPSSHRSPGGWPGVLSVTCLGILSTLMCGPILYSSLANSGKKFLQRVFTRKLKLKANKQKYQS